MKKTLEKFSFRRVILGFADAFIVIAASLFTNLILSFRGRDISHSDLLICFVVGSVTCCGCLLIFGAYNKLWRFFNKRDYLSCVYGVLSGFFFAGTFNYIIRKSLNLRFLLLHAFITLIGVCLFRVLFKQTFVTAANAL